MYSSHPASFLHCYLMCSVFHDLVVGLNMSLFVAILISMQNESARKIRAFVFGSCNNEVDVTCLS